MYSVVGGLPGLSERETEEAPLRALLAPLGLGIKEIRVSLWL
jgi:hypothetical protein